jgi:hypothetical protein
MVVMRAMMVLGYVFGCGRIHIDDLATDATSRVDSAPPAACAMDGVACDDSNICTQTSTCSGGACASTEALGPCTAADSVADFMPVQGLNGWYYGYWIEETDGDGQYQQTTDFASFVWNMADSAWRPPDFQPSGPGFSWAYLRWWGGHPGSTPMRKVPVRRWVSDVSGHAEAVAFHAKADTDGGDGTRAILIVDGVTILARDVEGDDGVGFTEVVPIELSVGSTVDLMLHYIGDEGFDTTDSRLTIRSR